jgi:heme/copper-type cytochrome/quinol oxidase subunit 1
MISRPYVVFWFLIPIILLVGLINPKEILDINIDDTYYVIQHSHLVILIAIYFCILGLGYWIIEKTCGKLIRNLNRVHLILTIGCLLIIWILFQFYQEIKPENLVDFIEGNKLNENISFAIFIITMVWIIGQLLFSVNLTITILKKVSKRNKPV